MRARFDSISFQPILARRKTPFLVLSRSVLQHSAEAFLEFAPMIKTFYSVKANTAPDLLRYMSDLDLGFEVSSRHELEVLLLLGIAPSRIITSNPVKAPQFIRYAYTNGIRQYAFDSVDEADKIAALAPQSDVVVRMHTDNSESKWPLEGKYGVEPDDALALVSYAADLQLRPVGLTFHVGSQCIGLASWRSAMDRAASVWDRADAVGIRLRLLNVGGGFPADHDPNIPETREILSSIVRYAREIFPPDVQLCVEPGRALVGNAGLLVASVIGRADRGEKRWVYLDIGVFNGLMESVGGISYTITPIGSSVQDGLETWDVAGPSCDSFDVIAKAVPLPRLDIGDRVAIYPGGAYTTVYASRFNGAAIPKTFLV